MQINLKHEEMGNSYLRDMTQYVPPRLYVSPHIETIAPALFRRVSGIDYQRERIETPDGDFLDLDWIGNNTERVLVVISHGLEGDSHRPYVKGMARAFSNSGYDVLAWNYRGCSGEMNRLPRFYHSGATEDLETVVNHAIEKGYTSIALVGFSLGGNLTLKYLGETRRPNEVIAGVTFSVPLDLGASCNQISRSDNWMYSRRFLRHLKEKVRQKAVAIPGSMDTEPLNKIRDLRTFDDAYTSVIHGFQNAQHYYESCSSLHYLEGIDRPVLLINALNDPFLPDECYPEESLRDHPHIKFIIPQRGGHVGFTLRNPVYWSEKIAVEFIENLTEHSMNNFLHS